MKTYKGIEYITFLNPILNFYCAYVKLPENHAFNKIIEYHNSHAFNKIINYDKIDISCHGGLTFGAEITEKNKQNYPQGFSVGVWIGWDYAHFGDELNFNLSEKLKIYYEKYDIHIKGILFLTSLIIFEFILGPFPFKIFINVFLIGYISCSIRRFYKIEKVLKQTKILFDEVLEVINEMIYFL